MNPLTGTGSDEHSPFTGTTPVTSLGSCNDTVTLIEGQTFCLSAATGDMVQSLPHGLFVLDTRMMSQWELRIDEHPLEPLTVDITEPFSATFVGRAYPSHGRADADVVAFRRRDIGSGMRERIAITNHGLDPVRVVVEMICDADFADLFAVKENRVRASGEYSRHQSRTGLSLDHRENDIHKGVEVHFSEPPTEGEGRVTWNVALRPRQTWEICIEIGGVGWRITGRATVHVLGPERCLGSSATAGLLASDAPCGDHRPRRSCRSRPPVRRGPRRAPDLRPGTTRRPDPRGWRAVVHDRVRP
jgi:hypothetical protein